MVQPSSYVLTFFTATVVVVVVRLPRPLATCCCRGAPAKGARVDRVAMVVQ